MAKRLTPEKQIRQHIDGIHKTIEQWQKIAVEGCSDPRWPDGANMNLLRNHLFCYKGQIRELCEEHNFPLPEEAYFPDLPYVDSDYFAKADSERAKGIMNRPNWQCYNHEEPQEPTYEIGQLSLI